MNQDLELPKKQEEQNGGLNKTTKIVVIIFIIFLLAIIGFIIFIFSGGGFKKETASSSSSSSDLVSSSEIIDGQSSIIDVSAIPFDNTLVLDEEVTNLLVLLGHLDNSDLPEYVGKKDDMSMEEKVKYLYPEFDQELKNSQYRKEYNCDESVIECSELLNKYNINIPVGEVFIDNYNIDWFDALTKKYQKFYGVDDKLEKMDIEIEPNVLSYKYDKENDCYIAFSKASGYEGPADIAIPFHKQVNDNEIIIDIMKIYLYDYNEISLGNGTIINFDFLTYYKELYNEKNELIGYRPIKALDIDKVIEGANIHRYIFKKDSVGNYYWYSTEVLRKY